MYEKYNVFHVFAGTHYAQKLNEVGIKPICGSNIVTNCGLKELVPYADVYVNSVEKWEAIRQGDIKNMNGCNALFWVAQSKFQAWCYEKLCNYRGDTFLFPNTIDCEDKYTFMPMKDRPKKVLWTGSRAIGKGWKQFDDVAKLLPEVEFIALSETEIPFTAKNIKPIFGSGMDLMPDLYKLGCMIVTTSLCENQPLGVIEAYATGLPCVAFDALDTPHGINEVVKNGKTGYLTKFGDPKDMAKAIDKLLKDDDLRAGMGVTAREWAVSHFDYRHTLRTMLNVYAEYLNRRMA
jgi:glycosyltransferase involved in cell wall biosynthesis